MGFIGTKRKSIDPILWSGPFGYPFVSNMARNDLEQGFPFFYISLCSDGSTGSVGKSVGLTGSDVMKKEMGFLGLKNYF